MKLTVKPDREHVFWIFCPERMDIEPDAPMTDLDDAEQGLNSKPSDISELMPVNGGSHFLSAE
jgi:hypothetical protein